MVLTAVQRAWEIVESFTDVSVGARPMERQPYHQPVLLIESIHLLNIHPGGMYVDCTIGEGGHATAILQQATPGGRLLGIDLDPETVQQAQHRLKSHQETLTLVQGNYASLVELAAKVGISQAHGVLIDLGLSSRQLEASGRGFTFQRDEPLDMRYDPNEELTAAMVVNEYAVEKLARLIQLYGEERRAWAIARAIASRRPLHSTRELANLVAEMNRRTRERIHPATRTFQALRIEVNQELENLEEGLTGAIELLKPGGRLVVISYHSLEDRIVKSTLGTEAKGCLCPPKSPTCICGHIARLKLVSRKVVRPSPQEVLANARSRGARMRVAERLP